MRRLVPLVVVLALAGCGGDDDEPAADTGGAVTGPDPTAPASSTAPTSPASTGPVHSAGSVAPPAGPTPPGGSDEAAARADLAAREGVDESAITTVSVEEVTWRDGSIGCPQPGRGYTEALVPGIRVVLELDGERYEYHAGGGRPMFLCTTPQPPFDG